MTIKAIVLSLLLGFSFDKPVDETAFRTLVFPDTFVPERVRPLSRSLKEALRADFKAISSDAPDPIREIDYEGMLDNHPDRIKTVKHLLDMDKLAVSYWHHSVFGDPASLELMMAYSLAWAEMYQPTGNPINENKLLPIAYSFIHIKDHLDREQKAKLEGWFRELAEAEINRENVPLNNWETKRINLVGTIGLLLQDADLLAWSEEKCKYYIRHALFADGSSTDIRDRDALSYHVNALKPLLQYLIALESSIGQGEKLFHLKTQNGASIARSLEFILPYAKGEKVYRQWENSKVRMDQERAAAGLEKYQPGIPYPPEKAYETMALAVYFDSKFRMHTCDVPLCQLISTEN
jgi:hypothetical protein